MKDDISFFVDLIINHKLTKATKDVILERIKQIEQSPKELIIPMQQSRLLAPIPLIGHQAPSILAKYPDLAIPPIVDDRPMCLRDDMEPLPVPVTRIAQTPETAKALADRQTAIAQSMSGKPEPGRTAPRKIGRQ